MYANFPAHVTVETSALCQKRDQDLYYPLSSSFNTVQTFPFAAAEFIFILEQSVLTTVEEFEISENRVLKILFVPRRVDTWRILD
jgi:hypothetical protein